MPEPVLIVGAGPTGLTAALELSRFGIPVRVIDKRAAPAETSRAIGVQARTLELLDRRGLAEELIRAGNPAHGGSIYGRGERLFHLDLTGLDSPYNFLLFVSQVETERVLGEAVARQGVTIEWGVELADLTQEAASLDPRPVKVLLHHADDRREPAEAAYLISAEGAHSTVRATLGLGFEGHTYTEHYALADLHLDGDLAVTDFHIFSSDHGFMAVFPLAAGHFRLIISNPLGKPDRGTPPSLEELQTVYDARSHIPARLRDLTWSSWFRINSRMVSRLQVGRCFLGGDSAHIHSPAGAQGMNTGIQDMINLGWKLALVLKGQAPASLLATYGDDRLPVIRAVLANTDRATGLMGSENPVIRGLVNHLGPWIGGASFVQHKAAETISQIALGYRASPLSQQWASKTGLNAGDRLPDLPVLIRSNSNDAWQDAHLHHRLDPSRFLLLITHPEAEPATPGDLRASVQPWTDLISVGELGPPAATSAATRFEVAFGSNPGAFLVRPDGYLALTATDSHAAHHLAEYCRAWLTESSAS